MVDFTVWAADGLLFWPFADSEGTDDAARWDSPGLGFKRIGVFLGD